MTDNDQPVTVTQADDLLARLRRPIPYTCPPGMRVVNPLTVNPDGPEAVDHIEALEQRLSVMREALERIMLAAMCGDATKQQIAEAARQALEQINTSTNVGDNNE